MTADCTGRPRRGGYIPLTHRLGGLLRALLRGQLRRRLAEDRDIAVIARSGLFDAAYYTARYPDVVTSQADPLVHYVRSGAREGRDPKPDFDTRFYWTAYPAVARAGINPLAHYARHGAAQGYRTHGGTGSSAAPPAAAPRLATADHLAALYDGGAVAGTAGESRRILVLDIATPTPDRDSGSFDTVALLRLLREQGWAVTFLPETMDNDGIYTDGLRRLGIDVLHRPAVTDLKTAIAAHAPGHDVVLISREPLARRTLGWVKQSAPGARVIFNTVDLHFLRQEREAARFADAALARRAVATRRSELDAINQADATLVVSSEEQVLLRGLAPAAKVWRMPVRRPLPDGPWPGFAERCGVVFVGGFRHAPNQDAVNWLLAEVWPRARRAGLAAPLYIVGADAPPFLGDDPDQEVRVLGHVPDLAPLLNRCRLSVAPIRYGAGLKGKVVDSLIHGLPVVATPMGVEGSGLCHDQHLLVADTAEDFAARMVALHDDPSLWQRLAEAGQAFARDAFSSGRAGQVLRDVMADLGYRG